MLFLESSAFLIVDLTFHGPRHTCPVRRQKSYSGSFAWLGNHPSLATLKGATVKVVKTCHLAQMSPDLYSKGNHQLAESKMALSRDHVVQKR